MGRKSKKQIERDEQIYQLTTLVAGEFSLQEVLDKLAEADPPTAAPKAPRDDGLARMAANRVSVLPVIDPDTGQLISSITTADVMGPVVGQRKHDRR